MEPMVLVETWHCTLSKMDSCRWVLKKSVTEKFWSLFNWASWLPSDICFTFLCVWYFCWASNWNWTDIGDRVEKITFNSELHLGFPVEYQIRFAQSFPIPFPLKFDWNDQRVQTSDGPSSLLEFCVWHARKFGNQLMVRPQTANPEWTVLSKLWKYTFSFKMRWINIWYNVFSYASSSTLYPSEWVGES